MKRLMLIGFILISYAGATQSLIGRWQLMKQSNCLETKLDDPNQSESMDELMSDFNAMKDRTADVLEFKDKMKGEQSTTLLGKRKDVNDKTFYYRLDGNKLHLLDRKSRTIIHSYLIEELTSSSLILKDANRDCEVKVFERIK